MSTSETGMSPMKVGPLRVAAFSALALVVGFFGITALLGGFSRLEIVEREAGPFAFAYRDLYGADFAQVGALSSEVAQQLERSGLAPIAPMAVFYGDSLEGRRPNEVGVLIDEEALARVAALDDPPKTRTIAQARSLTTSFPGTGAIAYMVGYFRAESVFGEHRDQRRYRREPLHVIVRSDRIDFVQPIVPN